MALERINLVPQTPIGEKIKKTAPLILGGFIIGILLFVGVKNSLLSRRIIAIDQELVTISNRIDQATQFQVQQKTLTDDIVKLNEEIASLQAKVTGIASIEADKRSFSRILTGISQALSPTMKCDKISIQGASGEMLGVALEYSDLPSFIDTLLANGLFKSATLKDVDRTVKEQRKNLAYRIAFELK